MISLPICCQPSQHQGTLVSLQGRHLIDRGARSRGDACELCCCAAAHACTAPGGVAAMRLEGSSEDCAQWRWRNFGPAPLRWRGSEGAALYRRQPRPALRVERKPPTPPMPSMGLYPDLEAAAGRADTLDTGREADGCCPPGWSVPPSVCPLSVCMPNFLASSSSAARRLSRMASSSAFCSAIFCAVSASRRSCCLKMAARRSSA
mmetsp:Transcript_35001/g.90896  ORF Transcript_35001/g.90896 Transcript_35001/m.90896 type:complete len:205 (-) Transcript_35001:444-1058(-)